MRRLTRHRQKRPMLWGVAACWLLASCAEPCDGIVPADVLGTGDTVLCEIVLISEGVAEVLCSDGQRFVQPADEPMTHLKGSYEVSSNMHALLIEHVTQVDGDLIFQSGGASKHTPSLKGIIRFPNLEHIGGFLTIRNNPGITRLEFPKLQTIGLGTGPSSPEDGGGFHLDNNDGLEHLLMPQLAQVGSTMNIDENETISSFDLSSLTFIGDYLDVLNNPSLATCLADQLVEQIQAGEGIGGPVTVSGNNDACTCDMTGDPVAVCPEGEPR